MLILPIKKQWFDMIKSEIKLEEYREIKPYYTTRFKNVGLLDENGCTENEVEVLFRNGYNGNSPAFVAKVKLEIKSGNPDWGAVPGIKYYTLNILEIL